MSMAKHVYFTRHGQTIWNVENKICGSTDIALTPLGHEQAEECGRKILEAGYPISEILYSPLCRAADTAKQIARITGLPLHPEERLREQCYGRFESTPRDGAAFREAKTHFIDSYGDGESMLRVAQRVYNLLDELKQDDRTFLLVAHNGIARVVRSYFYDMDHKAYADFGIRNCEILDFTF